MLKSCKITLKNHPPAYPQHSSRLEQMSITRLLHSLIQRERERRQTRVYGMGQAWGMKLSHEFLFSPSKPACIKETIN